MNNLEILKTLRICATPGTVQCHDCPYYPIYGLGHCAEHVMNDAANLIAVLGRLLDDALKCSVKPIPVTERLPEQDVPVLAWFEDGPIPRQNPDIVLWNGYGWMHRHLHRNVCGIMHWAPLPERPKWAPLPEPPNTEVE